MSSKSPAQCLNINVRTEMIDNKATPTHCHIKTPHTLSLTSKCEEYMKTDFWTIEGDKQTLEMHRSFVMLQAGLTKVVGIYKYKMLGLAKCTCYCTWIQKIIVDVIMDPDLPGWSILDPDLPGRYAIIMDTWGQRIGKRNCKFAPSIIKWCSPSTLHWQYINWQKYVGVTRFKQAFFQAKKIKSPVSGHRLASKSVQWFVLFIYFFFFLYIKFADARVWGDVRKNQKLETFLWALPGESEETHPSKKKSWSVTSELHEHSI